MAILLFELIFDRFIHCPVDLWMDMNGNFTGSDWQMKWQIYWQIYPTPCRSANGSEWQFHCYSSYWQMEVSRSTGRCYPTPCRSGHCSEWQFYSLSSYWQMKWQIYLLADLNGNFTVTATHCRYPTPSDLTMDLNGNFTLWAHIGRWSGKYSGRSTSL